MSDDERIRALEERYRSRLEAIALRIVRSPDDARDVVQEVFIATSKKLDTIPEGAEWAYLRTAVHNRAVNLATRRPDQVPLDDDVIDPNQHTKPTAESDLIARQERAAFDQRFKAAVSELPPESRLCLVMRYHGRSDEDIAARLGVTQATVRSRVSRAGKFLRERVGPIPPEVDWIEFPEEDER